MQKSIHKFKFKNIVFEGDLGLFLVPIIKVHSLHLLKEKLTGKVEPRSLLQIKVSYRVRTSELSGFPDQN